MENQNTTQTETISYPNEAHHRHGKISESNAWPIIIIVVGVYFLLRNFNIINDQVLDAVVDAWPLLLVWLGINLATKNNQRARTVGAVAVIAVLVFIVLQKTGLSMPRFR